MWYPPHPHLFESFCSSEFLTILKSPFSPYLFIRNLPSPYTISSNILAKVGFGHRILVQTKLFQHKLRISRRKFPIYKPGCKKAENYFQVWALDQMLLETFWGHMSIFGPKSQKCRKGGIMQALYATPAWACCFYVFMFFTLFLWEGWWIFFHA